jgi:hypothetical protein
MDDRRKKFEAWVLGQFGAEKIVLLSKVDGAYADGLINGMWFAFNAGAESADWDV